MSKKLIIKWTKPPPAYLAKEGLTMTMINVNVIWHEEDDVEVTQFFEFPLPKSENAKRSLLSQGYDTAKRSMRGDPNEVYPMCYKNVANREIFDKKWHQAKYLFLKRSPFNRASNDTFYSYVNSFGMTPKKFSEKTGVENSVLFRELKGQRKLSLDKAMTYAKALGCDPVDLLFEKQMCKLWGSVDLFKVIKEGINEGGLLGDQLILCPRDIYRPEIKAIHINSLGSHLHNHFAYYYRSDQSDDINENKMVVVGREIPELEELGMETMQYFFGILKIEKGKQQIINPEPTADKKILAYGPFKFIAPVVSLIKRGAMKRDLSYFESIEQSEKINEAQETIYAAQMKAQEELDKLLRTMNKNLADISNKEKELLVEKMQKTKLFKEIGKIPEYIRKKVG
jgi:transcriptional regulator with XRE-family HTH domain